MDSQGPWGSGLRPAASDGSDLAGWLDLRAEHGKAAEVFLTHALVKALTLQVQ